MCEKIITDLKKLQVQVYLVVNFTFSASLWELLRDDPGNENGWLPGHYPVAKHKSLNFSYPCFYTPGPPVMPHPVVMTMTLVLKRDLQVTWVTSPPAPAASHSPAAAAPNTAPSPRPALRTKGS